jgi:hypothetical protein
MSYALLGCVKHARTCELGVEYAKDRCEPASGYFRLLEGVPGAAHFEPPFDTFSFDTVFRFWRYLEWKGNTLGRFACCRHWRRWVTFTLLCSWGNGSLAFACESHIRRVWKATCM